MHYSYSIVCSVSMDRLCTCSNTHLAHTFSIWWGTLYICDVLVVITTATTVQAVGYILYWKLFQLSWENPHPTFCVFSQLCLMLNPQHTSFKCETICPHILDITQCYLLYIIEYWCKQTTTAFVQTQYTSLMHSSDFDKCTISLWVIMIIFDHIRSMCKINKITVNRNH